jgi:uncharacterized Fe-S cluster-containing radical SAM superfamily protein
MTQPDPASNTASTPQAATELPIDPAKFVDPRLTVSGRPRALVEIDRLETVWFNTGTLCNIECANCYIESSPSNNRLEYLTASEVAAYFVEISEAALPVRQIGFTGGEPFLNPELLDMVGDALQRAFDVLILTNAMRPMMRPQIQRRLLSLHEQYGQRLHIRVSVDHYTARLHEVERGEGSWEPMLNGLRWLADNEFHLSIAGRTCWREEPGAARVGYGELFRRESIPIDSDDPTQLVLFPEMDAGIDVPEITIDCWDILGVSSSAPMCASSRMIVKRRGASEPAVVACTLLPYESEFELGSSLQESLKPVWLNHPHCAKFCVLGGGSCSARKG